MIQDILAFSMLVVAALRDMKDRTIPTWVYGTGFVAGFGLALATAVFTNSPVILVSWLGGTLLMTLVALVLHKFKAWMGGDAKLLIALGSILGFSASVDYLFVMSLVGGLYALACWLFAKFKYNQSWGVVAKEHPMPFAPAMALAEVGRWYV